MTNFEKWILVVTGILIVLIVGTYAGNAQDFYPRPYISGGLSLEPPGYASTAFNIGGGLQFNRPRIVFDSYAGYDNGRKVNDNDNSPTSKGHDRYLRGFAGFKRGKNYIGAGARWTDLSTPAYTDFSWHPEAGLGRDWSEYIRTQAAWEFPPSKSVTRYPNDTTCYGCTSGAKGVDFSAWIPSPASNHRFFARVNILVFSYHATLTEPHCNPTLTAQQIADKYIGGSTEFQFGYRF